MASLDLNKPLAVGSPVTLHVTGAIGVLTFRDGFLGTVAANLSAAGLEPAASSLAFGLFSTQYDGVMTIRTTVSVVTAFQVAWHVEQAAKSASGGNAPSAVNVTEIGSPGDVVTPATEPGIFDPITKAIGEAIAGLSKGIADGVGLDVKKVGEWITTLLKVAAVLVVVVGLLWALFETGVGPRLARAVA